MLYTKCISRHTKLPSPHFTATNVVGTNLVDFEYTGDTTGVKDYIWNFGDNTYAYMQNPSHTYDSAGIYTVSLIIGNGVITKSISLTISVSSVDDDFTGNDGDAPNTQLWDQVLFSGSATSNIYGNKLRHVYTTASLGDFRTISKFEIANDFDIQVDFGIVVNGASGLSTCDLEMASYDDNHVLRYLLSRVAVYPSYCQYHAYVNGQSVAVGATIYVPTGKLGVVRTGSDVYMYGWDGTAWVLTGTFTGMITGKMNGWLRTSSIYVLKNFTVDFDNFIVNSGTII